MLAGIGIGWMYGTQLSLGDPNFLLGSLVALCVPIAGAVQWTLAQKSQSDGHSLDLVPSVLLGAVFSTLLTLPLAVPFQASTHDVGLLAILGLFQLAIPCVLSVVCVRVLKATRSVVAVSARNRVWHRIGLVGRERSASNERIVGRVPGPGGFAHEPMVRLETKQCLMSSRRLKAASAALPSTAPRR